MTKKFRVLSTFLFSFLFLSFMSPPVSAQTVTEVFNAPLRTDPLPSGWSGNNYNFQTGSGGYLLFTSGLTKINTNSFDLSNQPGTYALTGSFAKEGSGGDGKIKIEVQYDGAPYTAVGTTAFTNGTNYKSFSFTLPGTPSAHTSVVIRFSNDDNRNKRIRDVKLTRSFTLPITFFKFTASHADHKTKLMWATANEVNNSHFEIQNSQDGKTFSSIGKVSSENNESGSNYTFTDNFKYSGTVYYRLKSVDFDSNFEMSKIIAVNFENKSNSLELTANLVTQQLPIRIANTTKGPISYFITDLNGRVVLLEGNLSISESTEFNINVSTLATGMYILKTKMNGEIQSFKFVKQ